MQLPSDTEELYIDSRSNAWFTLGSESEILVSLRAVTVFKLLNDRQSEFRESSEPIMYNTISQLRTFKHPKKIFIISIRICRIARSWHPSRVSVFPMSVMLTPPPPLGGNLSRVFLYLAGIYAQFSWARSLELSHSDVGTEVVIQTLILQKKCGVEL